MLDIAQLSFSDCLKLSLKHLDEDMFVKWKFKLLIFKDGSRKTVVTLLSRA